MLNISFELALKIHFFEAFQQKGPELGITVAEGFKAKTKDFFSFHQKLLKVP